MSRSNEILEKLNTATEVVNEEESINENKYLADFKSASGKLKSCISEFSRALENAEDEFKKYPKSFNANKTMMTLGRQLSAIEHSKELDKLVSMANNQQDMEK